MKYTVSDSFNFYEYSFNTGSPAIKQTESINDTQPYFILGVRALHCLWSLISC